APLPVVVLVLDAARALLRDVRLGRRVGLAALVGEVEAGLVHGGGRRGDGLLAAPRLADASAEHDGEGEKKDGRKAGAPGRGQGLRASCRPDAREPDLTVLGAT